MPFIYKNRIIPFNKPEELNGIEEINSIASEIINSTHQWQDQSVTEFEFYTSGSTGIPKLIKHSRESILYSIGITKRYFKLNENETSALCLPIKSVAGKMMLFRALHLKLNLELVPLSSIPNLTQKSYHFLPLSVMQFSSLIDNGFEFNKVNIVLLGGAPITEQIISQMGGLETEVYHGYGMTETLTHIAMRAISYQDDENKPFNALDKVIFNTDQNQCLIIKAPHLVEEVKTHDIVDLINDKAFRYKGRYDNIINSGGIKVIPEEMEKSLKSLIKKNLIISWLSSDKLGQEIVILIESDYDQSIINHLINRTLWTNFRIKPKVLFFLDVFEYTKTGKINREETRKKIEKSQSIKLY